MHLLRALRNRLEAGDTAAIDLAVSMLSRVKVVDLTDEEAQVLGELARDKAKPVQQEWTVLIRHHNSDLSQSHVVQAFNKADAIEAASRMHTHMAKDAQGNPLDSYNFVAIPGRHELFFDE